MPIRKPTVFVGGGITLAENVAVDVPTSVWQWQNRSEGTGRSYAGNGSTVPDGLTKAWQIVGIDENGQVIIKNIQILITVTRITMGMRLKLYGLVITGPLAILQDLMTKFTLVQLQILLQVLPLVIMPIISLQNLP